MAKLLSKSEIIDQYTKWSSLINPTPIEARRRGYAFENILYSLLEHENLEPMSSYNKGGEQIDGSFFYLGQTFLMEAKWHKDTLPVSSVYSFKGKVDGKFHTTSGIFISISGFSEDVRDALRFGKSINVLLFDKGDIDSIILSHISFIDVLKFKIRQAGDTGDAYTKFELKDEVQLISDSTPIFSGSSQSSSSKRNVDLHGVWGNANDPLFLVICEGRMDERYLSQLFEKMTFYDSVAFQFKVLDGAYNLIKSIPSIINILNQTEKTKLDLCGVVIILDEDKKAKKALSSFHEILKDTLSKSASGIGIFTLNLDSSKIAKMLNEDVDIDSAVELKHLRAFINNKIFVEDDIEMREGEKRIQEILKRIEWDPDDESAYYPGEDKYDGKTFKTLDELRSFLEEEAESAASDEVSNDSEFRETYETPDFIDIVHECLEEYEDEIKSINWTLD